LATPTYTAIASITLGSSASSVTFSNIPQDYRDLVLVANCSSNRSSNSDALDININSTGTSGSAVFMRVNVGSPQSGTSTTLSIARIAANGASKEVGIAQIMDYSATDKHKTILARSGSTAATTSAQLGASALRWENTAAVTSIELDSTTSSLLTSGSTFALWGIAS